MSFEYRREELGIIGSKIRDDDVANSYLGETALPLPYPDPSLLLSVPLPLSSPYPTLFFSVNPSRHLAARCCLLVVLT